MINSQLLLIFLLAHFMGDFVLQTDKVAKLKVSSFNGLLLHVSIVTLTQAVFLSIYGLKGIVFALAAGVIHILIDYSKIHLKKLFRKEFILFLTDQIIHILVIFGVVYMFGSNEGIRNIPISNIQIKFVIIFILLTYVTTIAIQIIIRDLYIINKPDFFYKNERVIDSIISLCFFGCLLLTGFGWALLLVLYYIYIKFFGFYYSTAIIKTKFIILTAINLIVYLHN
ncbi:MAG: DUF3307 domain-containing protein [Bacillota bacterium]